MIGVSFRTDMALDSTLNAAPGLLPRAKVDPHVIYSFGTEEVFGEAAAFLRSESMGAESEHPLVWDRAASRWHEEACRGVNLFSPTIFP
jgi:hypothetical protein